MDVAKKSLKALTSTARQLEQFSREGLRLEDILQVATDYCYLFVKPNYIIYRIEGQEIKIIRILNEKQDFMQTLFGLSSISDEGVEHWGE